MDELLDDLDLALDLADLADRLTMRAFTGRTFEVVDKPDGSVVTDADRAVEQAIGERLRVARPDDAILGEELGASGDGPRRWVVDPIDGTSAFVAGSVAWGTLIALEVDGVYTIGVASLPSQPARWWGAVGAGAWCSGASGRPVVVSADRTGGPFRWASNPTVARLADDPDLDALGTLPLLGDQVPPTEWTTYPALMVADGRFDAAAHRGGEWDVAALAAIVAAAGGRTWRGPAASAGRRWMAYSSPAAAAAVSAALAW